MADNNGGDSSNGNGPVQETIRAKRIELVRDDGKVVAVLGFIGTHPLDPAAAVFGGVGLTILDEDGRPQIRLTSAGLTIYSPDGLVRTQIRSDIFGGGLLVTHNPQLNEGFGNFVVALGAYDTEGSPLLTISQFDAGGQMHERALLSSETIQLTDLSGVVKFKAPS